MATPRKLAAIILAAATTVLANPVDVDLDKRAPTPVRAAALLRHTTYTYGNGYANVRTGLAIWVIIVIVIGVISSLCLCCLCCYCLRRHMGRDDKGPSTIPHYPPEPIMPQNYTTAPYDQGGMGYAGAGAPPVPPQYGSYPPEPYGQPPPPPGGGIGMVSACAGWRGRRGLSLTHCSAICLNHPILPPSRSTPKDISRRHTVATSALHPTRPSTQSTSRPCSLRITIGDSRNHKANGFNGLFARRWTATHAQVTLRL